MSLRTDYKNDVLNTAINAERQFEEVTNPNGTKSYRDVTDYTQVGDSFDADLVNTQNAEINAKAPIESPNFTGNPTAPTKSQSVEDDSLATTAFVKAALTNAIDQNLRTSGKAADAKATGDKLNSIQESVPTVDTTLKTSGAAADAKVTGDSVRSILNALVSETTTEAQVASCYDAAGEFPIKRLVANIIPKQDFNGYDHPWVGGAGKNLLPNHAVGSVIQSGITFDIRKDGSIRAYGTATAQATLFIIPNNTLTLQPGTYRCIKPPTDCEFIIGGNDNTSGLPYKTIYSSTTDPTFTITKTGTTGYSILRVQKGATVDTVFYPQITLGSEVLPYEPYENICPISGYTGLTVTRTGQNVLELKDKNLDGNGLVGGITDKVLTLKGTVTTKFDRYIDTAPIKDGTYILNGCAKFKNSAEGYWYIYDVNTAKTLLTGANPNGSTVVIPNTANVRIGLIIYPNVSVDIECMPVLTEVASTYPVTFPSAVGAVYGGTLMVNSDGSGTLTVDKAGFVLDSSYTYMKSSLYPGSFYRVTTSFNPQIKNFMQGGTLLCSHLKYVGRPIQEAYQYGCSGLDGSVNMWVDDTGDMTVEGFGAYLDEQKAAGKPFTVIGDMVTPRIYTLSAVQVVELLQGVNNVWMDADGTLFFEYYANTALYVKKITNAQKEMIAGVEESMTATKNYVIGDLMIVGDSLYKVTAAISSGASLVIGTNITQTTVAEQLIALAKA